MLSRDGDTSTTAGIAGSLRRGLAGAKDGAKRVLVLVPTTGSANRVVRIQARPDLNASQIFHRYWPLDISRYYAALTEGPLAALGFPLAPGAYHLWLADEIESGNSWELPVLLAHAAVAFGHELVDDPARADVVLWATGAIECDLRLHACNYRLAAKVAHSRDDLRQAAAAGARIVAAVPASEDASPLRCALAAAGAQDVRVESVDSVRAACGVIEQELGCLQSASAPALAVAAETPAPAAPPRTRGLFWKIPALLAAGAAMALGPSIAGNVLFPAPPAAATPPSDPVRFDPVRFDPVTLPKPRRAGGWSCIPVLYRKDVR
jgi:hypothetical protein